MSTPSDATIAAVEGVVLPLADEQQKDRLAKFLSITQAEFAQLLQQLQSQDTVTPALQRLVKQLDTAQGEAEQLKQSAEEAKARLSNAEINIDQRLQQSEAKINVFKNQLSTTKQKLVAITKEKDEANAKAAELESKLAAQQSGSMHTGVELESLKSQIESLEIEKRDALAMVERKGTELDQVNEDYQRLNERFLEVKKEASAFESDYRAAKASEMTYTLQKQTLEQELQLRTQQLEWAKSELDAKSKELVEYRNEKNTQILKLQGELDKANLNSTTMDQSNTILHRRVRELETKLVESIQKFKEQKDQAEEKEEQFRIDVENQRRLGSLWEESANASKARVADLEQIVDELQLKLSQKDASTDEAIEKLAEEKTQLQIKLEESAVEIEKLKETQKRADELLAQAGLVDIKSGGFELGKLGILSPTAAIAGRALKQGMSLTQVYTEYTRVLEEKAALKAENQRLQDSLNEIVEELSNGAPLIRNQQLEYQRLKEHAEELSAQLEESNVEKRELAIGAQDAMTQLDAVVKERDMLHKENQDLDRQVQNLLWRIKAPNAPQSLAPESTQPPKNSGQSLSDAERVIEDHLVLFSNVQELQLQNKQLRQIARELTKKVDDLDGPEAQEKRKVEQDVMEEAERTIVALQDEIHAKNVEIVSYKQEVDMLRRTLKSHNVRGVPSSKIVTSATMDHLASPGDTSAMRPSTTTGPKESGVEVDPLTHGTAAAPGDASELARLLSETQKSYDAYRQETSQDMKTLREQLSQAQSENSNFRIQLGRANTQVEVMDERYKLILQNNQHLSTEMSELRKRLTSIQEAATRHEIENQKMSTELFSHRETAARLNAEINNLKAEKSIWKSFENRLIEENKSLGKEKSHLSDLLTSIQSMANELERTKEQSKRRHESALASKEQEIDSLKAKLKEETEQLQRLRDRKETEGKEHQAKIDSLTADYQSAREQYIAAKTTLEHTNAKVEDLNKQLKSKEEQLAIYQQKPSDSGGSQESTREEMLEAQVKQLQAELARKQEELEIKSKHVVQYQAISQTAEERLAEHIASSEESKKAYETMEAENAATIKSLEAKLAAAEERAEATANELTAAQTKLDEESSAWFKEKETLEVRLKALEKVEKEMSDIESRFREDLRVQAAAAKEAHENYERELMNHAKDMEALTKVKQENTALEADLAKQKSAADAAVANLQSAELSWESQKNILQKNLAELEKRCSELKKQNDKLHSHLEDISSQAMSIQQRLSTPFTTAEGSTEEGGAVSAASDGAAAAVKGSLEHQNAELRDVIRFVRREKDIEAHKYEMSQQENKRLKLQLDQVNRSLEEARKSLMEERNRQQDDMFNRQEYERLLEKVNQYNMVYESNSLLRSEKEKLECKVQELEGKIREHEQQMEPMRVKLREMESDLENTQALLKQTTEDRDRWRSRNAEIMAKYDRIDPTEFQELKDAVAKHEANEAEYKTKVTELEASKAELMTKYDALTTKVTELESSLTEEREKANGVAARVKQVNKAAVEWRRRAQELEENNKKIPELEAKLEEATKASGSNEALQKELEDLKKESETFKAESENFKSKFDDAKKKYNDLGQKYRAHNARIRELEAQKAELEKKVAENGSAAEEGNNSVNVDAAVENAVKAKEAELEAKHAAELASLKAAATNTNGSPVDTATAEARAKAEKELEDLRREVNMTKMRNSLIVQAKDKEIAKLKELLADHAPAGNNNNNGGESAPTPPTTTPSTLSASAAAFRPRSGVNSGAASPSATAPGSPSATPARPPGVAANSVRPTPANQAQLLRQQQQAQQQTPTPAGAQSPQVRPGQGRLRPPLAERLAAAQRGAEAQKTATAASAATAPPAVTAAPTPAAATATTAGAAGTRPISIKRRREGELPARVVPTTAATTTDSTTTGAAEAASAGGASPVVLKRPRQRPASADGTTAATLAAATPTTTPPSATQPLPMAATTDAAEAASGHRITLRRNRVAGVESTETPPASPPTASTSTVATSTTTVMTSAETSSTTVTAEATDANAKLPHGLKRRHESSESTVQESITIVSTPGASGAAATEDVEEEMVDVTVNATTTTTSESTAMEVDEVPPVKRPRPSSHVTIEEVPDESGATSNAGVPLLNAPESGGGSVPGTPSQFDTLDDEDTEAPAGAATTQAEESQEQPVTPGAAMVDEEGGEFDDHHHDVSAVDATATTATAGTGNGELEEVLDEGDDLGMVAGGEAENDVEEGEMTEDVDAGEHLHQQDDTEDPAMLDE